MRVEHLTDIELQGWLTLFWMGQDGQDVVLREEWDLDVRSSASDVLDGVARLCARHEILRSNFGIDSSGDPVRMVTDPIDFTPPVTIVDSGSPEFAPEIGGAVSDGRYLWQMVLAVDGGAVSSVRLYLRHILADAFGMAVWRTDLSSAILDPEWDPPLPVVGRQFTLTGETGRTGNEQRTAGWAHAPQAVVPVVRSTVPHSHYCAATAVPGLGTELEVLGDDAGVGSTVCAKFAVAWAMSQLSGQSNVLLANVVYTDSFESREIACRTFNVRESISIRAEDTFLSALREMRRNSLDAYMALMECGFSSDIDRDALILQRRGIGGAAPTYFDYIPLQQMAAEVTEIVEGQKQAVSSIGQNMVDCLSPVFILEQLNDSDVRMNILADDKVISRDLALELPFIVYRFVRLARRLSMRVATARELFRDRDRLHVGSRLVANRWVQTDVLRSCLVDAPGVLDATVTVTEDRVRADIVLADGAAVFDVHEFITAHVFADRRICAPDVYRWRTAQCQVSDEWFPGNGAVPRLPCRTRNEEVLVEVMGELHQEKVSNLALTYLGAGGRLRRAPAVVERLRLRGLAGLRREHFETTFSLRMLGTLLRPIDVVTPCS